MQESFLHYLWQFQQFNKNHLQTTDGQPLHVLKTGSLNSNAGPDFLQARIVIGTTEWAGSVEMHLRSGDWQQHRHHENAAYENVVLHVVWEHNQPVMRQDNSLIPTLALAPLTDKTLITKYLALLENLTSIPCAPQWAAVKDIHKRQALDKALMHRLQEKAAMVEELYKKTEHSWEETAYQVLARNFGFKINAEAMLALAQSLPLKILQKHADSLLQIEALLFGQAGLLPSQSENAYVQSLRREYHFLKHKYQLESSVTAEQWKFLRLRPANFPTLRLAQFAALLHRHPLLFSSFLSLQNPDELAIRWQVTPSAYWQEHYHFGKISRHIGKLGKDSLHNILINSAMPLLVAYANYKSETSYTERAVTWLEALPAENNKITRLWEDIGQPIQNAFDSQASLGLYHHFCTGRRCLSCPVGVALLR